jgi:uncharacterized protein
MEPDPGCLDTTVAEHTLQDRKLQTKEAAVVILLVIPLLFYMVLFLLVKSAVPFPVATSLIILRDVAAMILLFSLLKRNKEPLSLIGWSFKSHWKDIFLGIVLFLPFSSMISHIAGFLSDIGLAHSQQSLSFLSYNGTGNTLLAIIFVIVVAISEETIFRGYLIWRLRGVTGNIGLAVILSIISFALGHSYLGTLGIVTAGLMGGIFALIFLWRKNLVAVITMHFLQDFFALMLSHLPH